jgi:phosphoglycolate phosphatase
MLKKSFTSLRFYVMAVESGGFGMTSVVFDLDGTLADTSADLIAAANACFDTSPLDPVADALTAFGGGRAMLKLGFSRLGAFSDADIDAEFPRLLEFYAANIDTHTTLYDGVVDALDALKQRGHLLGVCTNKPEGLAQELLIRLGIRDYFTAMLGADTLPVRKPDPVHLWTTIDQMGGQRDRAVLIGDTITDRNAAKNADVPCILVSFGPEGDGVNRMEPSALLDHYSQLPDLIDRIIP